MSGSGPGSDHWTAIYRTDPLAAYEIEGPIFDNPELTRQELELVEAMARELGASLDPPVVDVACGPGRHSLELARRGRAAVGFDHSLGLLRIAAAAARTDRTLRERPGLVCASVDAPPFRGAAFASALLLGKSFGYFSDRHNQEVLGHVRALLRPGGFFGLELPDREPYLASMRPVEREERVRANGERLRSEYRCRWHATSSRLVVRESHLLPASGETLWEGEWDVRLYSAAEIEGLMRAAGFAEVAVRQVRLVEAQGAKGDVLIVGGVTPTPPSR